MVSYVAKEDGLKIFPIVRQKKRFTMLLRVDTDNERKEKKLRDTL